MNENLVKVLEAGTGGCIVAAANRANPARLGDYDELRHRYNQMACLIGGVALQRLHGVVLPSDPNCARPPAGTWVDYLSNHTGPGVPVGPAERLFALAAKGPCVDAENVGYLAFRDCWPEGMSTLHDTKLVRHVMSQMLGRVFYEFDNFSEVYIGAAAEPVVRLVQDGTAAARKLGYAPHDEPGLIDFMVQLMAARWLHYGFKGHWM